MMTKSQVEAASQHMRTASCFGAARRPVAQHLHHVAGELMPQDLGATSTENLHVERVRKTKPSLLGELQDVGASQCSSLGFGEGIGRILTDDGHRGGSLQGRLVQPVEPLTNQLGQTAGGCRNALELPAMDSVNKSSLVERAGDDFPQVQWIPIGDGANAGAGVGVSGPPIMCVASSSTSASVKPSTTT